MAPSFEDILRSDQFTFLIGEEQTPIVVHAAAIAATSKKMERLINGHMGEAQNRRAEFKDIEVADFTRFCEYAYRNDYVVLNPSSNSETQDNPSEPTASQKVKPTPPTSTPEPEVSTFNAYDYISNPFLQPGNDVPLRFQPPATIYPLEWDQPTFQGRKNRSSRNKHINLPTPKADLRAALESRNYLLSNSTAPFPPPTPPQPHSNSSPTEDFTPVFLAHARLYIFASIHLIAPLQALTLHKLHQTLLSFRLYHERAGDIVTLARYVYASPDLADRGDDGTVDEMKRLVVEYVACEIDTIGRCGEFVGLMEEGGEFVGDFWGLMKRYFV